MPHYKKAPELQERANALLKKYDSHKPLVDCRVRIDFLFAYGDRDEDSGELINNALNCQGYPALGITRVLPIKDRVKGLGDAEICIDGDWWFGGNADEAKQDALLDHELHHVAVKTVKGILQLDAAGRPRIKLRKHDVDFGWFKTIADRHGPASMEQFQAKLIFDAMGQSFWPQLTDSSKGALKRIRGE